MPIRSLWNLNTPIFRKGNGHAKITDINKPFSFNQDLTKWALEQRKKYYYTNANGESVYYDEPKSKVDWLRWNGIDNVITNNRYYDDDIQSIRDRIWDDASQSYDKSKLTDEDRLKLYDSVERVRAERGNAPGWNQMQSYEEYLGNTYSDAQLSEWANRNEYAVDGGDFSDDDAFYSWDRKKHPEHYYKYYNGLLPDDYDETGNNLLYTNTGEAVGIEPQFAPETIETPVEPVEQPPVHTGEKLLPVPKIQRRRVSEPQFQPETIETPVEPVEQSPTFTEGKLLSVPKFQRRGVGEPQFQPDAIESPIEPVEPLSVYTEEKLQPVPKIQRRDSSVQQKSWFGNLIKKGGSSIGNFTAGIGNAYAKENSQFTSGQAATQDAIRGVIGQLGLIGAATSAVTGVLDAIGSVTGSNLSNIDADDAERAGLSSSTSVGHNIINSLPGTSMLAYGIGKAFFGGGTSKGFKKSQDTESVADVYSGTMDDLNAAEGVAGKNYFNGGERRRANRFIDKMQIANRTLADIGRTNTMRRQSDYSQNIQNQNINTYAGTNYLNYQVGKNGLKLRTVDEIRSIMNKTAKLQDGGNIPGIDSNIIPEGSLHAHKNHLDELNPDLEDATKKGIPVIAADTNDELKDQVAEVEKEELILRLDVTKKIEELMKNGSEEAMIEAGKILVEEIIENTEDPNDVIEIDKLQDGGNNI